MAKMSSKRARKPVPADEPMDLTPVAEPADEPVLSNPQVKPSAVAVAATQLATPPAPARPVEAPPKLLTPLAAAWPQTTPTEPAPTPPTAPPSAAAGTRATLHSVKVVFVLVEPDAKQVWLSGDFNSWSRDGTPMRRSQDGRWETSLALTPGRYEYKFLADGQWLPDPLAREQVWNRHGTLNSVVEVPS